MLPLILSILFFQDLNKDQFVLLEKDPISFSKLINQIKEVNEVKKQEECFT